MGRATRRDASGGGVAEGGVRPGAEGHGALSEQATRAGAARGRRKRAGDLNYTGSVRTNG
jgi:hypothetical protein